MPLLWAFWQTPPVQQPGLVVEVAHSQPSVLTPVAELQSARPEAQPVYMQRLFWQVAPTVLVWLQALAQPPQWARSLRVSVSQPSVLGAAWRQSAKGLLQV